MIDYYWATIEILYQQKNTAYGWCSYHVEEDFAQIFIDPSCSYSDKKSTLVHELGHVWQGMKKDDLATCIEWPENHSAGLTAREDFPEVLRVAICGFDSNHDESIIFEYVQGIFEPYLKPVAEDVLQAFQKQCADEVVRILGFMPTIPTI